MIEKQDLQVLEKLREDSRKTLTDIGEELGLPITTVFEKVKKLKRKVIVKYVDLLAFEKMGFGVQVNFMVKTEERKREKLKEFLLNHRNVNSVFRTNNGFDFFIETIFSDMKQFDAFCERLDSFRAKKKMHFVIEPLKQECFFPNTE